MKEINRIAELEQENAELKKEVKQIGFDFIKKGDYARALEQENAELKEKLNGKRFICTDCMAFAKRIEQYKQTLQEIKKTAEQSNVDCIYRISVIRAILTKAEEE